MKLFEERCSGSGGVFVEVEVGERKFFLEAEGDNRDSISVEISGAIVAGIEACESAILEISSDVKFQGSCVQP